MKTRRSIRGSRTKTYRSIHGGDRGIRSRVREVADKLFETAQADFYHDFGEGVPERDKFTGGDLQRFTEIAQGYGISKVNASIAGFKSVIGSTPYNLIKNVISSKIFPSVGENRKFMDEISALRNLGIDYIAIKDAFKAKLKEEATASAIQIEDILITLPDGETRTYEVTGILMKDKQGVGTFNIASRFEGVTRGKSKIALIIDASGGLSMTSLINTDLPDPPTNKMEFHILENIENDSDSATKLKTLDKPKGETNVDKEPNVYFLKDQVNTVLYPNFNLSESKSDAELLFGNANLVLSRAGDETEADFTFADNTTYHIENVSQNANVKNASLNILASSLAEGGSITDNGEIEVPEGVRKPFLFPYIKRVGDWCQALSLLDGTRVYNKLDVNHRDTGKQTTLDELREQDTVIGLLTLDRILLGYALTLGIDVFFTTSTDLRMLLYFHNKEVRLPDEQLQAKIDQLKAVFDAELSTIGKDAVPAILDEAIAYVKSATGDTDFIQRLRGALYRVSVLRTEFETLTTKVNEIMKKLGEELKLDVRRTTYFDGITLLRKLKEDETHNNIQRKSFATYPALVSEKAKFQLINLRPQSRGAVSELKRILSVEIHNDAIQSKRIFEKYKKQTLLPEFLAFEPTTPVFQDIFGALDETRILFGAAQRGGGESDIAALKQFQVTPLTQQQYSKQMNLPPIDQPLPLIVGTFYRDKKSLPYTVVDQYIVTRDSLPIFQRILASKMGESMDTTGGAVDPRVLKSIPSKRDESLDKKAKRLLARREEIRQAVLVGRRSGTTQEDDKFLATRLMLLYADILQGEMEKLLATEDYQTVPSTDSTQSQDVIAPSDVKATEHKRIYYKVAQLMRVSSTYITPQKWDYAFRDAFNEFEGADLLDSEGLDQIPKGQETLRDPGDYNRTLAKIQTLRNSLIGVIRRQTEGGKHRTRRNRRRSIKHRSSGA